MFLTAEQAAERAPWPKGRRWDRETVELNYRVRRQRPQPCWTALGMSQEKAEWANEQSCRAAVGDALRDIRVGELRYERRWRAAFPLDYLRGLPRVTDDTRAAGVYFLWFQAALVYVGQSASVAIRVGQHAGKVFTHATYLDLGKSWRRESTEALNIRAHEPPYNIHPGHLL